MHIFSDKHNYLNANIISYWASLVAQMVKNPLQCRRSGFDPWVGKTPGVGHSNPLQYSCLENPHDQRSLAVYSPWRYKESDMTEQLTYVGKEERLRRAHT